jgi:hypothetical protein
MYFGGVMPPSFATVANRGVQSALPLGKQPASLAGPVKTVEGSTPSQCAFESIRGFPRWVDTGTSSPAAVESPLPGNNWRPRPTTSEISVAATRPVWDRDQVCSTQTSPTLEVRRTRQ